MKLIASTLPVLEAELTRRFPGGGSAADAVPAVAELFASLRDIARPLIVHLQVGAFNKGWKRGTTRYVAVVASDSPDGWREHIEDYETVVLVEAPYLTPQAISAALGDVYPTEAPPERYVWSLAGVDLGLAWWRVPGADPRADIELESTRDEVLETGPLLREDDALFVVAPWRNGAVPIRWLSHATPRGLYLVAELWWEQWVRRSPKVSPHPMVEEMWERLREAGWGVG